MRIGSGPKLISKTLDQLWKRRIPGAPHTGFVREQTMVGIVTGQGLGLQSSSALGLGGKGQLGDAGFGKAGE